MFTGNSRISRPTKRCPSHCVERLTATSYYTLIVIENAQTGRKTVILDKNQHNDYCPGIENKIFSLYVGLTIHSVMYHTILRNANGQDTRIYTHGN
jgi:hypothetical protein